MAFKKNPVGWGVEFIGKRIFIGADTIHLIWKDKDLKAEAKKYGFTYVITCLVHEALGAPAPELPTAAMARGGKKSRALARKKGFKKGYKKKKKGDDDDDDD
jgi:hypothetical protein